MAYRTAGVYLIHLEPSYKHARHYLGYADDIERRLKEHRKGQGGRLCQVAVEAGCKLILARVWSYRDRKFERRLKNRKESPRLCPICNARIDGEINFNLPDAPIETH